MQRHAEAVASLRVADGIDASRRIAWARFYEMEQERDRLLKLNAALEERLAGLVIWIAESEVLCVMEPEGELIVKARSILAALRRRPRGITALEKAKKERKDRAS